MKEGNIVEFSFLEPIDVSITKVTYNMEEEKTITIPISKYDELYRQQGLYSSENSRANAAEREVIMLKQEILNLQEQLQEAYTKIKNLT